ncbi:MAG: DivIVA domain-containing protein [Acidobacteria bacterium]|jgi:cell division initiation protein|nr:DivIVA domain-containing protein [Acidobacteriota bacterium]
MKLTPQEILSQTFSKKLKGFDGNEVRNFLQQVAETLESEIQEKEELRKGMERLRESLAKLERKEELLRDTLIAAQKFSSEIKANSHKEAELITRDAEIKSEEIVKHAAIRQMAIREEIKNLQFKRKEIESDIIHLLNSLKELIETYHKQDEEFDKIEYLGK